MKIIASILALLLVALAFGQGGYVGPKGYIGPNGYVGGAGAFTSASIVQPTIANPLASTCAQFPGTPTTCAMPLNVTSGNVLYVYVVAATTGTLGTPTKSSGTSTIGAFSAIGGGSTAGGEQQWYKASITGSGSLTLTSTFSTSNDVGLFPFEVSNDGGVDSGTNPVYEALNPFCTTGCNTVSITTVANGDLVLYANMFGASTTPSTLSPYTLSGSNNVTSSNQLPWLTGNYTEVTAGTVSGTFNQTSTAAYQDSAIAIK